MVIATMTYNIQINAAYLPGKDNRLPDLISRSQISQFHQEAPWAYVMPTTVPIHLLPFNLFPT